MFGHKFTISPAFPRSNRVILSVHCKYSLKNVFGRRRFSPNRLGTFSFLCRYNLAGLENFVWPTGSSVLDKTKRKRTKTKTKKTFYLCSKLITSVSLRPNFNILRSPCVLASPSPHNLQCLLLDDLILFLVNLESFHPSILTSPRPSVPT